MKKSIKGVAMGTLFAAAVGYITGILTAPKSGKETREDIKAKAVHARNELEKNLKSLHSELSTLIDQGTQKAANVTKAAQKQYKAALETAHSAKDKAREALSAFHEGHADDKDLEKAVKEVNSAIAHLKKFMRMEK